MTQMVKNLPAMWEIWVRYLGCDDPLEKRMATHSSIPVWRIPWTEEPGKLQSMGLQRVGHDLGEASKQYVCVWLIHFATRYSCKASTFQ